MAADLEVLRCHPAAYMARVRAAEPQDGWAQLDGDTWLSPGSIEAALRAVGGACAAVDAVLQVGVLIAAFMLMFIFWRHDAEALKARLGESVLFPRRLGAPDEVAAMVVECLRNPYVNGTVVRVDGGIRLPPK